MVTSDGVAALRGHYSDVPFVADHPALLGLVDIDPGGGKIFVNSVPVSARQYLVPDGRGSWTILSERGSRRTSGTFAQQTLPVESDVQSLIAIGGVVKNGLGGTWEELEDVSPSVPDLGSRIRLTPLELAIVRYLPYLEEACARPKAYLKVETTRVFVSQARRMPARAVPYLASHTEDWEKPLLRSVRAKRVLAEVREDEFDIYENRLAARLVDRLLSVVEPRIAEVRKAQRILSELLDYETATGGFHWRAKRVCSLWAETVTAVQSEKRSRSTLEQLTAVRQRLLALMDSPLYGSIPRRADVSDSLKMTNILATDPVYKYIAKLWLEWSRQTAQKQRAPADIFAEYRALCHSFGTYCLLLVVRALAQLGISADVSQKDHRIGPGNTLRLSRKNLSLSVTSAGVIQLKAKGSVVMSFTPLPAAINRARSDEELDLWMERIRSALHEIAESSHTVVLYLSSVVGSSKSLSLQANNHLQVVGNELGLTRENVGFMPVSPWEIDCVERVGRCLRWAITGRDLLQYPAAVRSVLPSRLKANALPRWLSSTGRGLRILRHPCPQEWLALEIDQIWQAAKHTLEVAEAEEKRAVDVLQHGRPAPHLRKSLAQDVTRARKAADEARMVFEQVDVFRKEIRGILDDRIDVSVCPVCGTQANTSLGFRWDTNFYEFVCTDCNANWGVRTCRCGARVPFLQAGPQVPDKDRAPGWIDRYLGRDVLAVPCGEGAFVCTACGATV